MAFCLLLRLLTMRSTSNQMQLMLDHKDSPYIRAIGFLYLRYTCDPAHLFRWYKAYLFDDEPIEVSAKKTAIPGRGRGGSSAGEPTIGSFVRSLLSADRDFHGTMLPRLPVQIERDMQVRLLQAEKVQRRAEAHSRDKKTMDLFQKLGSKVMATYEDEDNPLRWYTAEVDRVVLRREDGSLFKHPRFVVTFTEYGNTETVLLGEMDVPNGNFFHEDQRGGGGSARRGDGYGHDLYDEVRRRERDSAQASGRSGYSRRPPSTTGRMSGGDGGRGYHDRRRRSPSPDRKRSPPPYNNHDHHHRGGNNDRSDGRGRAGGGPSNSPPPRKRTAEELAAIQEKKRRLMAKYG